MLALLPLLAGDIPWSAGGLMRCFDLVTEEGTINNATFPAAVSRGPIGPGLAHRQPRRRVPVADARPVAGARACNVQATCCGTWDTAVIAGPRRARRRSRCRSSTIMMEPMAGGYGAQPDADGMDTGGLFCIPMGRVPDVEMTEFLYPVLALWRREEPDSGGPGRQRGGVSARRWRSPRTGRASRWASCWPSAGKAVSQNNGLAGGYPGNTGARADRARQRPVGRARRRAAARGPRRDRRRAGDVSLLRARPTWRPARCSRCTGRAAAGTATP